MADEMISKKILKGKLRMGKPRAKWKDVVRGDTAHIQGIRRWGRRAEGREERRRVLREGRAQKGAVAP
jgi:hypothetical protein